MINDSHGRADLERIWEAHRLSPIRAVTMPRRGEVNRCFIVNEELVIRFSGRETGACRFRNEQVENSVDSRCQSKPARRRDR
jgi:hypothetical protein